MMNFKENIANYVLGNVQTHELIQIGEQALIEGYDSPSLAKLAGESAGQTYYPYDVERYFKMALHELGLDFPDKQQASKIVILHYLNQMLVGNLAPQSALDKIYVYVYFQYGAEQDKKVMGRYLDISALFGIYFSYDEINDAGAVYNGRFITQTEAFDLLDEKAKEEAKNYIDRHSNT